jgi:hypothetical protein
MAFETVRPIPFRFFREYRCQVTGGQDSRAAEIRSSAGSIPGRWQCK